MELDSVRGLKAQLLGVELAAPASALAIPIEHADRPAATAAGDDHHPRLPRTVALGVHARAGNDYQLAIRVQEPYLLTADVIQTIRKAARNEVDLRYVGHLVKLDVSRPWQRRRQRPLRIGVSIAHEDVGAGTLGAFVKLRNGEIRILSNNHVLANENKGQPGDPILQPSYNDRGRVATDTVATLATFIPLYRTRDNRVDAALAVLAEGVRYDAERLHGRTRLAGVLKDVAAVRGYVEKVGRTTGHTRGRITAFDIDRLQVGYDMGNLRFAGQIEIEGGDAMAFSSDGDSGSLIYTSDDHLAVALLFAGSQTGGKHRTGVTYANPITSVFSRLKVSLP